VFCVGMSGLKHVFDEGVEALGVVAPTSCAVDVGGELCPLCPWVPYAGVIGSGVEN
jgi:hypothetical protein